jgi:hypothetical protein
MILRLSESARLGLHCGLQGTRENLGDRDGRDSELKFSGGVPPKYGPKPFGELGVRFEEINDRRGNHQQEVAVLGWRSPIREANSLGPIREDDDEWGRIEIPNSRWDWPLSSNAIGPPILSGKKPTRGWGVREPAAC